MRLYEDEIKATVSASAKLRCESLHTIHTLAISKHMVVKSTCESCKLSLLLEVNVDDRVDIGFVGAGRRIISRFKWIFK
jgi:hypothetical protein